MNTKRHGWVYLLVLCVLLSGCTKQEERAEVSTDMAEYYRPMGRDNCIPAKAVVTYYLPKERIYLTAQEHLFCPDAKGLQIHSREPQGTFTWKWSSGQYNITNPLN